MPDHAPRDLVDHASRFQEREARAVVADHAAVSDAMPSSWTDAHRHGLLLLDVQGVVTSANPAACALLGTPRHLLVGSRLSDRAPGLVGEDGSLLPPVDLPPMRALRLGISQHEVPVGLPLQGGGTCWMVVNAEPIWAAERILVGVAVTLTDDTQRRIAHRTLVDSEARLRATLDTFLDPHIVLEAMRDENGRIVDFVYVLANAAACAFNRLSHDKLIGTRLLGKHPAAATTDLLKRYVRVVETGEPMALTDWTYPQDLLGGELRQYDVRAVRFRDGISQTWRDVTERHRQLALLEAQRVDLEVAQRIAHVGSWMWDPVASEVRWSSELLRILGLPSDGPAPASVDLEGYLTAETWSRVVEAAAATRTTGVPFETLVEVIQAEGAHRWAIARGEMVPDASGCLRGTLTDVTDAHLAHASLEASEARFRGAFEDNPEGIGVYAPVFDEDGRFADLEVLFVNRVARDRFFGGVPEASLVGSHVFQRWPAARADWFEPYRRAWETREVVRVEGHALRGEPAHYWSDVALCPFDGGIVHVSVDVTARRNAELALRERTRELEEARELAHLGVWRRDARTGAITSWSPQMDRMFGLDPDDGPPTEDDFEAIVGAQARRRRDVQALSSAASGEPWTDEVEIIRPDGERRWILYRGVAETDAAGEITGIHGTAQDVTEQRLAMLAEQRFGAELERRVAQRTAALEAANEELRSFSYTVSHDLRAPVRAIAGFSRILARDYADSLDAAGLHKLDNIAAAGETMGRMIDDLLAYSRVGQAAVHHEPVLLADEVEQLRIALAARLEETAGQIVVIDPLVTPLADRSLLDRVLLNLADNGLAYRRPGVPPVIRIATQALGDSVEITVSDNGVGIPSEAYERIFEVFTRLRADGDTSRSGIGLATVRRAVRAMGSEIGVHSKVGVGTTFSFRLPVADPR